MGQRWHTAQEPLSLADAQVSIALAAVSGGMFELGDDMPLLSTEPDRIALVKNHDLLQVARLGRAALPLDLMTYKAEDTMPSVYLTKEDRRVTVLTVFNWSEKARSHTFALAELGLPQGDSYTASDVLDNSRSVKLVGGKLGARRPTAHSVRMIKLVDTSVAAAAPTITAEVPSGAETGGVVKLAATAKVNGVPAIA
jgi:alpha-galactosidase